MQKYIKEKNERYEINEMKEWKTYKNYILMNEICKMNKFR